MPETSPDLAGHLRSSKGVHVNSFQKTAAIVNKFVEPLLRLPVLDKVLGKAMVTITYVGRKSGKTISLPVSYRQKGDDLLIGVAAPDKKNWWRNFLGEGAPVTVALRGEKRTGHAVSTRNDAGQVSVKVALDPVTS